MDVVGLHCHHKTIHSMFTAFIIILQNFNWQYEKLVKYCILINITLNEIAMINCETYQSLLSIKNSYTINDIIVWLYGT